MVSTTREILPRRARRLLDLAAREFDVTWSRSEARPRRVFALSRILSIGPSAICRRPVSRKAAPETCGFAERRLRRLLRRQTSLTLSQREVNFHGKSSQFPWDPVITGSMRAPFIFRCKFRSTLFYSTHVAFHFSSMKDA